MERSGHSVLVVDLNGQRFTEMNQAGLVVVAQRGETAAFGLLYRKYAERTLRTVRQITQSHEDAEDAVQEAFLCVFRHIQTFDGRSTFSTWLTRFGINSALMMVRKNRNSREVTPAQDSGSESPWEGTGSAPDPEQQYAEQERLKLVRDAIAGLPPTIRGALEIHTLQGQSVAPLQEPLRRKGKRCRVRSSRKRRTKVSCRAPSARSRSHFCSH